jgi:3-oxoacyl-[acyl-carrier-protein] synthase II
MMRRRVVITGMGMVTPVGHSVAETFAALLEGKSGVDRITHFDARTFPTTFAAEVKDFDLSKFVPDAGRYAKCGSNTRFSLAAARQALDDAGLRGHDPTRAGVYLGAGEGSEDFDTVISGIGMATADGRSVDHGAFARAAVGMLDGKREAELEMNTSAGHVADANELLGPNYTCLTACAASAQAVGEAVEMVRCGDADVMLAGGAHSMIHPFGVSGFNLLTALSLHNSDPKKASRPFDLTRTYRMTDPHPEARGAGKCMANAIADAGITPDDIGYINAHGTSTQANDECETAGIKMALGAAAYKVPVSSSKSMLGHLIAAGGVVELMVAVLAMRKGVLPPTINYETPDPACDLDYVPNVAREVSGVRHVLSNSFGFGGQNITLVASRI